MKKQNLSNDVYQQLKKDILDLKYYPGEKISEHTLTKRFGTSRTPVKNAITRLEMEDLIRVIPQKGTFVSPIDIEELIKQFDHRMLLEVAIFNDFLQKKQPSIVENLKLNIEKQKLLLRLDISLDVSREFWKLDNEFHHTIFLNAGKSYLWEYVNNNLYNLTRFRIVANSRNGKFLSQRIIEHEEILNLFIKKSKDVRELYERHVFSHFETIVAELQSKYPSYFEYKEKNEKI